MDEWMVDVIISLLCVSLIVFEKKKQHAGEKRKTIAAVEQQMVA
jgi:hypothetical protein